MPQYRNVRSAIHNCAHSLLSVENYDDGTYFIGELVRLAKDSCVECVTIDGLKQEIQPERVNTERVTRFLGSCRQRLEAQLVRQNVEPRMVSSVSLAICFDFSVPPAASTGYSFRDPWLAPEAVSYEARVEAVDDRGKRHHTTVSEWWR